VAAAGLMHDRGMRARVLAAALVAGIALVATAAPALAAKTGPSATVPPTSTTIVSTPQGNVRVTPVSSTGITVSWLPVSQPVTAIPGQTTTGQFWVTNEEDQAVVVQITPATAVPENDGVLGIQAGADQRFPSITYNPTITTVGPHQTIPVTVTVYTPTSLAAGTYIVPALVRPLTAPQHNIKVNTTINALVTFQIPGPSNPKVAVHFLTPNGDGTPQSFHIPGIPLLQVGTSGAQDLRVLDVGGYSFYATAEVYSTQTPFGTAALEGHQGSDRTTLSTPTNLYYLGRYRDVLVLWSPLPVGIGVAHLEADVGTQHGGMYIETTTTTDVLVISPLWFLVYAAILLAVLAWIRRRTRLVKAAGDRAAPRHRSLRDRLVQAAGALTMVVLVAALCFTCDPLVVIVGGVIGEAVMVGEWVTGRARPRTEVADRHLWFLWGILALIAAGVVCLILATLGEIAPSIGLSVFAVAGISELMGIVTNWWNEERTPREARPADAGEPGEGAKEREPAPA
jgi:hypothetical protein